MGYIDPMSLTEELPPAADGDLLWDPTDAAFRANPYPYYERLRRTVPVYAVPGGPIVVTRYEDVMRVLRSPDVSRDIEANAIVDPNDEVLAKRRARRQTRAKSILNLDAPDHTRLRRLVSKAFTPRQIERLRPRMEEMVDSALEKAAARGSMELLDDLAFPVPFLVISELLDMPTDRGDELRDWSQAITASLEPMATVETLEGAEAAVEQLIPYLIEVIEDRRAHPGDDVLSLLLAVEDEGDTLSPAELISFVVLLYVAGHETTVNLIGNGLLALLRNPAELARWRSNPEMDALAVDELLRFDGPVQHTVRVAMKPMDFLGAAGETITVQPGHTILTVLGAANHDPAVFENPNQLVLDRPNASRHTAFSAGAHYCLGASLAKLEASVVITRLIRRFERLEMAGEPQFRDRLTIRGVSHLPLVVR